MSVRKALNCKRGVLMENTIGSIILFLTGAVPGFVLAYAIGVKKAVDLIAGWDASKISNPEAYASLVGIGLFILAINITAAAVLLFSGAISENLLVLLIVGSALVPVICAIYGRVKYGRME